MKPKVEQCTQGELPDLNKCTARTLTKSIGLSPKLAQDILAYRRKKGRFAHVRELWNVENMTMPMFEFLVANYGVHKKQPKKKKSAKGGPLRKAKAKTRLVKRAGSKKRNRKSKKKVKETPGPGFFDQAVITMNPIDVIRSTSGNALTVTYRAINPRMRKNVSSGPGIRISDKSAEVTESKMYTSGIDSSNNVTTAGQTRARDKQNDEEEAIWGNKRDGARKEFQTSQNRKGNYERDTFVQSKHPQTDGGKIGKSPLNQKTETTDTALTVERVRSAQADQEKPNRLKSIEKWINDVEQTGVLSDVADDRKSGAVNLAGKHRGSKSVTLKTDSSKHGAAFVDSPDLKRESRRSESRGNAQMRDRVKTSKSRGSARSDLKDGNSGLEQKKSKYAEGSDLQPSRSGKMGGQRSEVPKYGISNFEPIPGTSGEVFDQPKVSKSSVSKKYANDDSYVKDDSKQQQQQWQQQQQKTPQQQREGADDANSRRHRHRHGEKHRHRHRDHKHREGRSDRERHKERSRDRRRSRDDRDNSCTIT